MIERLFFVSDSNNSKLSKSLKQSDKNLRLALDIGTNSIGWAIYHLDEYKKPVGIVGTGVRIFSSGRKPKDYTTLNANRRKARLQRRQRDRYLQRRTYLLHLLKKYGLFPEDKFSARKLADLNPYELRARGLDEKLDIYHFGRVLFHLNQRRGFKSNRKSSDEHEGGIIAQSIEKSKEQLKSWGVRTYGEFLWKRFEEMQESRKKPSSQQENWVLARKPIGSGNKDSYAVYADRSMLEDEFHKLWSSQSSYHEKLKDDKLKDIFFEAIFHQRKLKKPVVGTCFFTGDKRVHTALPSFQKFRILKELNNLAYNKHGRNYLIVEMERGLEFRDYVIKKLFQTKDKVKFSLLEKEFHKFFPDIESFSKFNLDTPNRDYLQGDQASFMLKKIIPEWMKYSLEIQDRFVELLEGESKEDDFIEDDKDVLEKLKNFSEEHNLNLSEYQLESCMRKLSRLPSGHGSYSKKVIDKIMPFLKEGQLEPKALESAGWHHSDRGYKGEVLSKLLRYQEVLKHHCVPICLKSNQEDPEHKKIRIPNPTVHIAFNQLRLLVNDIMRVYGKPYQVVVETARDLPLGQKTKRELERKQKKNKDRNEESKKFIKEFGQLDNRANRIRHQLWIEQNMVCVYSGKPIPENKLFTSKLEVDHILPYSRTLDDSFMNKVLCYKSSNQQKGNQTPFEVFSSDREQWLAILSRVPKSKKARFDKDAMEKFEEKGNFLERQLNDTRYISRHATHYLQTICKNVWSVRGQTTAVLRYILQYEEKSRDDHRHHAKDALAIGLVDRSLVQRISSIAKSIEKGEKRLENLGKIIKEQTDILPWSSFKKDAKKSIDSIVVSHRTRTKKEGQLHNETAYGVLNNVNDLLKQIDVIHYVDILTLSGVNEKKIKDKIVSERIKRDFLKELEDNKNLSKEFLIDYHKKTGIRRVRLKEKEKVIPIKNKSGKIYKYFNGCGNYAMRFCLSSNGRWDAQVIDTFSANQKGFPSIPKKSILMKGDMVFFDGKFWRLVKFDQNKKMVFVEHCTSGNPDDLSKNDLTKCHVSRKTPSSFQQSKPKRVDISPCGVIKLSEFVLINTDLRKTSKQSA
ncbi:MAG: type II CRISPR RNA-guided endonuclease Cas9 [Bdellovibrionales bacterium]|nr:type II CRISPR RNA-guided endonuclease Cas9 [Bdellovibrionales bacterium]